MKLGESIVISFRNLKLDNFKFLLYFINGDLWCF